VPIEWVWTVPVSYSDRVNLAFAGKFERY
jgi:hypothetical protein